MATYVRICEVQYKQLSNMHANWNKILEYIETILKFSMKTRKICLLD